MKVLGIVVVYYPDDRVAGNIRSYLPETDRLILWKNTPAGAAPRTPLRFDAEEERKIVRMGTGRNVGLGTPLNEAVRYAREHGFTHLLTMDQDSRFEPGAAAAFFRTAAASSDLRIASFSASVHPYREPMPEREDIGLCITSGTLYALPVFEQAGLFRADFFIDAVDTEFCFRLRRLGWKMVRLNRIYLHHELGRVTQTPFLWGKLITPNYPAERTYYLSRNTLVVRKLYPEYRQSTGTFRMLYFWRPICILAVETDKWRKLKAIVRGAWHGWRGLTGEAGAPFRFRPEKTGCAETAADKMP